MGIPRKKLVASRKKERKGQNRELYHLRTCVGDDRRRIERPEAAVRYAYICAYIRIYIYIYMHSESQCSFSFE